MGQTLEGALYLATPAPNGEAHNNPFNTLLSAYIVAEDPISGVLIKLPGSVSLNPVSGRITTTFENSPDLAFEDAEIHLYGGKRAPVDTPTHCGTYTTETAFTPWSGTPSTKSSSSFTISSGPEGSHCPRTVLPFAPTLTAGTANLRAGAFSPLSLVLQRESGQQRIAQAEGTGPAGLSAVIANITPCPGPAGRPGDLSRVLADRARDGHRRPGASRSRFRCLGTPTFRSI